MTRIILILLISISMLIGCQANDTNNQAFPSSNSSTQETEISQSPRSTLAPTPFPNPDLTVCASGCDFTLIQDAIEAERTVEGTVIGVIEPVQTEAGILVSKNVIIQGKGAQKTIVQAHLNPGEGTQRVFEVPLDVTVTIRGMTVQHGNPSTSPLTGGGILNYGTLTLEDMIIRENFGSAGGGLYSEGTLTLLNSTVSENGSVGGGDAYLECATGGGLKVLSGTTTLINSTVSNNHAKSKGGGIHVACHGKLIMQNSTISSNFATESGGGIYLNGSGDFTSCTISNNSASNVGGLALNGRDDIKDYGQLRLFNTIISDNIARLGDYGISDCHLEGYAEILASGYTWIADGNCEPVFSGNPMLGPLVDNGGSTLTHRLLPGSPAIDAIPSESCVVDTDQRGEPRLTPCDIGAYEVQKP
ncbi:MAG: hypothetical protein JW757_01885 [Anaerolineales bacterium]|nr:hypothetical protein [Anaerolineales bacterium]